jgi:hypothetical protein
MLNIFAVLMVKDEEDIIEYNIEYLQKQKIDHIFVANNLSSDNTKNILLSLSKKYGNMTVIDDDEFGYYQAKKMNKWIKKCYEMGADIIIPIDADEIWYSKIPNKLLSDVLRDHCNGHCIFVADVIEFIPSEKNINYTNPLQSLIYVKETSDYPPSVAFTKFYDSFISHGNHIIHNHPGKNIHDVIGIKHYQYRNFNQFVRKVKNGKLVYDAATLPSSIGGDHWKSLGGKNIDELKKWWDDYISQPKKVYKEHFSL